MKRTVFADLEAQGRVQVALPRIIFEQLPGLRPLDLLGVAGRSIRTECGEPAVMVERIRWWHPCLLSSGVAQSKLCANVVYTALSSLLISTREVLRETGFHELITDSLRPSYQGGRARPFATWSHFLDRRLYLRVTSEIALKGAIARGMYRAYEIGPDVQK